MVQVAFGLFFFSELGTLPKRKDSLLECGGPWFFLIGSLVLFLISFVAGAIASFMSRWPKATSQK